MRWNVEYDWDHANIAHIAVHGVSTAEVEYVLSNDPFDLEAQTESGEERLVQIGETLARRILVVVTTWRQEKIRVVTAFDAPKALKTYYMVQRGNWNG